MNFYPRWLSVLALGLPACASFRPLALGDYNETRGPGVIMWTSKQLRILPNQAFEYTLSSDDVQSGYNGAGTYRQQGRNLILRFNGKPLVQATSAQASPLSDEADSLRLTVEVQQADAWNALLPAFGVAVLVRDQRGNIKAGVPTDTAGRARVNLSHGWFPCTLHVSYIGYQELLVPVPESSTAFKVYLQPSLGRLYPDSTVLRFKVLRKTAHQLVLGQGNEKITLVTRHIARP